MNTPDIPYEEVEKQVSILKEEAESAGYHLNPDVEVTGELVKGLLINEKRYGYRACPCRLASGDKEKDLDIICPCDYRDPDLNDYDACYCSLYVSQEVLDGKKEVEPIPERRPSPGKRNKMKAEKKSKPSGGFLPLPVWRCKVCGYLCARDEPPGVCPICKAKKERFEQFM